MSKSISGLEIKLHVDCPATRIPSGDAVTLQAGESFTVAQALGGSVTLRDGSGLYRVAMESIPLLGPEVANAVSKQDFASLNTSEEFGEDTIWSALRHCFDPEIPVNIVDLGLIYDLQIQPKDAGKHHVEVKMTLTATGCGMGPTIAADAKEKILALPDVVSANVEIVWDPQWTPHMISEEGRKILGLN